MWINTELFRTEAKHFLKYGRYCDDPPRTPAAMEYWDEQLRRCEEGYSVGGKKITGHHYGYLNFAQIKLTEDTGLEDLIKSKKRIGKKITSFPDFWDGDYEYFWVLDIARNGIDKKAYEALGLEAKILKLDGGYHLIIMKARRKGFSFKNAWVAANTYNLHRGSTTIIGAFEKKYLYPKGTMTMAVSYLDFLNSHTDWTKRRKVVNRQDHVKASFYQDINGQDVEVGYKSEIIGVTFKDNPDAARGKDAAWVFMEECGVFDNLKPSFRATEPSVTDGGLVTGQMVLFGTGGDMEIGTVDFENMFYNPEPWNLLPIENIWDDGAHGTSCGYFFPQIKNLKGFYDKDGNSDLQAAKEYELGIRERIKSSSTDPKALDGYIVERPFSPSEGFMQTSSNIFPVAELNKMRNKLIIDKTLSSIGVSGILEQDGFQVSFRPSDTVRPITKYNVGKGDDTTGCVVIYQPPYKDEHNNTPDGMYFIAHDPYAMDTTGTKLSLGATYVFKRPNKYSRPDDMIVATYVGRPDEQDTYNSNLFKLAAYYNARIGFENDRGEVVPFAKRFNLQRWLMEEPELFDKSSNFRLRKLGRKYGISISSAERKSQGLVYLRDWLKTSRGKDEHGEQTLNLHYIFDMPTLEELLHFNPKGNFDRVSALLVGMYYMKAMSNIEVETEEYEEGFFDRDFF